MPNCRLCKLANEVLQELKVVKAAHYDDHRKWEILNNMKAELGMTECKQCKLLIADVNTYSCTLIYSTSDQPLKESDVNLVKLNDIFGK